MPYANPQSLVSIEWLAGHFKSPGVRVVDASWFLPNSGKTGRAEFERAHIPGAVFFDIDEVAGPADTGLPHMMPSATRFAARVGKLGLGNGNKIVVYDRVGGGSAAARVWAMFRTFGHMDVALLDGGFAKWQSENKAVDAELFPPRDRPFTPTQGKMQWRDRAAMLANQSSHAEQVIDARSRARFAGTAPEPREGLRPGHIPGSRNLPWDELLAPETKTMLPAEELQRRFVAAGIDLAKPVVASCGSGVTACMLAFGLHLIGKDDVSIYDGSWSDWGRPGDTPVAMGEP